MNLHNFFQKILHITNSTISQIIYNNTDDNINDTNDRDDNIYDTNDYIYDINNIDINTNSIDNTMNDYDHYIKKNNRIHFRKNIKKNNDL
jgi:hypothetical protein